MPNRSSILAGNSRWLGVVITLAIAAVVVTTGQAGDEAQVDISVIGKDNVAVTNLTVADVTVTEDGVRREVVRVEADTRPMHIAWLTRSVSMVLTAAQLPALAGRTPQNQARLAQVDALFRGWIAHMLAVAPKSELSLVAWSDPPTAHAGFGTDVAAVLKAETDLGAQLPMTTDSRTGAVSTIDVTDIVNACRAMRDAQAGRAAIIIETGFADESLAPRVEEALRQSGVALWVLADNINTDPRAYVNSIGARSIGPGANLPDSAVPSALRQFSLGLNAAKNVAVASGGWRIVHSPKGNIDTIATLLATQQLVTYRRPVSVTAATKLAVTVSRKNVEVAATSWPPK